MLGLPDPIYVTQKSLCHDATLIEFTGTELVDQIKTIQKERQERAAQLAQLEQQWQEETDRISLQ
jgi:hypothetical protein